MAAEANFRIDALDATLRQRLAHFDIHPSGPLWGRGLPETSARIQTLEVECAAQYAEVAQLLETEGLRQERRPLRCVPRDLSVDAEADRVTVQFTLGRGQFATAVLRELCAFKTLPELDSADD